MAKGAKRTATAIKKLKGTVDKRTAPDTEPVADEALPQAPGDLTPEELAWFELVTARLDKLRIASATDSELITMVARRLQEITELSAVIEADGRVVESYNPKTQQTLLRTHPAVSQRNEAMRHLQALLAECGLTPASRSKVSAKVERQTDNPFAAKKTLLTKEIDMKKLILIVLLALLAAFVAPSLEAQQWPDNYKGDQVELDGCIGVIAEMIEWNDMNPWGMVSPVGVQYYGTLCPHDGTETPIEAVELRFEYIVHERCQEPPWSGADIECEYRPTVVLEQPWKLLTFWNGAYISYLHEDATKVPYEALVFDEDSETAIFTDGVFEFVTPLWFYEDDSFTRYRYELREATGELVEAKQRRGSARR